MSSCTQIPCAIDLAPFMGSATDQSKFLKNFEIVSETSCRLSRMYKPQQGLVEFHYGNVLPKTNEPSTTEYDFDVLEISCPNSLIRMKPAFRPEYICIMAKNVLATP